MALEQFIFGRYESPGEAGAERCRVVTAGAIAGPPLQEEAGPGPSGSAWEEELIAGVLRGRMAASLCFPNHPPVEPDIVVDHRPK